MLGATAVARAAGPAGPRASRVVGTIPAGLPAPGLPDVGAADVVRAARPALGVALVGYTDNILTGRAFAARHGERIDAKRELLALGAANLGAGLLHGFPVSSSGSRTAIGDAVGGRTQLASLVTVAAPSLAILLAGPVLAAFPPPALGAVVVYAAVRLVDVRSSVASPGSGAASSLLALATTVACCWSGCSTGSSWPSGSRCSTCCAGSPGPTTRSQGYVPDVAGHA